MTRESPDVKDNPVAPDGRRSVELLFGDNKARPFGYRIGGVRAGPTVVVAGYSMVAGAVYDKLLELPTLPWLRGTLLLVTLDWLDLQQFEDRSFADLGAIDRMLHLPLATTPMIKTGSCRRATGWCCSCAPSSG